MEEKTCGTCKYFAQHYRKWGKGYHEVDCGHCKYPRIKKRTKDQTCPCLLYTSPSPRDS